ncbi:MAG: lipopolysaccharide heptosyltransferase II [Verrucomicrobiota bacterium]
MIEEKKSQAPSLNPYKILVRGVNWLGDAVMSMPALQSLREGMPEAHITLLTHEKLADLWRNHSALDAVRTFSSGESPWHVGKKLRQENFQLALALPNSHRSAIELWCGRIPRRIGYTRPWRSLFLTQTILPRAGAIEMKKRRVSEIRKLVARSPSWTTPPLEPAAHHIFQYLHLVEALGVKAQPIAPQITISESELATFRTRIQAMSGSATSLWFGLNPGAEYGPAKRWPTERFVAAALELHQQTKCGWLIFGANDPATREVAEALEKKIAGNAFVNLAGQTTLRELCVGLKFCKLVLTNDTGPMHVAAAVGTPVVVPFGSTSAELTGPGLPGGDHHALLQAAVPCAPCFLRDCPIDFRCMRSIEVKTVVAACRGILKTL